LFKHEPNTIHVNEILATNKVKTLQIVGWTLPLEKHVRKINMGMVDEPKYLKLNADLKQIVVAKVEKMLREFTNVLA
jgi:hypothetical protein